MFNEANMKNIYLDNNATTQILPEVKDVIQQFIIDELGNASSSHSLGRRWRSKIEEARVSVAELAGCDPHEIIFTSGGTESNNWILQAFSDHNNEKQIILTTCVEHPSILNTCNYLESRGHSVKYLPVEPGGRINLDLFQKELTQDVSLVSIQYANSETGVTQPINAISEICLEREIPFHTDAVQAFGKVDKRIVHSGFTFASFSSHKIHGLSGTGALYIRKGHLLSPILHGGAQENLSRAGTENILGILAFGAACESRNSKLSATIALFELQRKTFLDILNKEVSGLRLNGDQKNNVRNCLNLFFPGIEVGALIARMDKKGVFFSQYSACSSGNIESSYTLNAMGISRQEAWSSARISFSEMNSLGEVKEAAKLISNEIKTIRALMR